MRKHVIVSGALLGTENSTSVRCQLNFPEGKLVRSTMINLSIAFAILLCIARGRSKKNSYIDVNNPLA